MMRGASFGQEVPILRKRANLIGAPCSQNNSSPIIISSSIKFAEGSPRTDISNEQDCLVSIIYSRENGGIKFTDRICTSAIPFICEVSNPE